MCRPVSCLCAALVLAVLLYQAPVVQAQQGGAGSSGADVPGHPAFRAGARVLAGDDWSGTDIGDIPESLKLAGGTAEIVAERGRRFLRVTESASFDVVLSEHLPESYTIDFDMQVPSSTGYAVEVRPDLPGSRGGYAGVSRRAEHPVALCGSIGSGVYGAALDATKRFEDGFAAAMVPCQIVVSAKGVKVYYAGQLAANVPGASLGQTNRVRIHVPASGGAAALIGPIRVATDVGADLVAGAAAAAEAPPAAARAASANRSPEPAAEQRPDQPAPVSAPVAAQPVSDTLAQREPASSTSAARSATRAAAAGSGIKGLGDRIRRRAEARAAARLDSAADKAEQKVGSTTEKALDAAADVTDKALDATDRIVSCLVTDLRCIRRAKHAGAKVAVTDTQGHAVSTADSAQAVARANQPPPASPAKP